MSASVTPLTAGILERAAATLVDALSLLVGGLVVGFPLTAMSGFFLETLLKRDDMIYWRSFCFICPVLILAYGVALPARSGVTFGRQILGIRIVRKNGAPLDFAVSVVRNLDLVIAALGAVLTAATLDPLTAFLTFYALVAVASFRLLDALVVAVTRDKRGLRDRLAGTIVVRK